MKDFNIGDIVRTKYTGNIVGSTEYIIVDILEIRSLGNESITYAYIINTAIPKRNIKVLAENIIKNTDYLANKDTMRELLIDHYGTHTYLDTLEVGARFDVVNGGWSGEITLEDGVKCVLVDGDTVGRPITAADTLVINLVLNRRKR